MEAFKTGAPGWLPGEMSQSKIEQMVPTPPPAMRPPSVMQPPPVAQPLPGMPLPPIAQPLPANQFQPLAQPMPATHLPPVIMMPESPCIDMVLVMSYVKMQKWDQTYELDTGFKRGTIFPELDLPFMGEGGCCNE